jgi:hypothetical protein
MLLNSVRSRFEPKSEARNPTHTNNLNTQGLIYIHKCYLSLVNNIVYTEVFRNSKIQC